MEAGQENVHSGDAARGAQLRLDRSVRSAAATILMCALAAAVLAVARSGSQVGTPLEALAAVWKPFPVPGMNVAYSKIPPSFQAENFDAGRLPKIGFSAAPAGGWDGKLPVVPIRENEKNHPLQGTLKPFERLPAVQQANISAAHALAAAEVAANAYGGEGGGQDEQGVEGEAHDVQGDQVNAATSASESKGALKVLEKSALTLTAKAEAAMSALERAELRMEQQEQQPGIRQQQETHPQLAKRELTSSSPQSHSVSGRPSWGEDSREAGALLAARREVDSALRRIGEKHEALRRPRSMQDEEATRRHSARTHEEKQDGDMQLRGPPDVEQTNGMRGVNEVDQELSRAARHLYRHYAKEYQDALDENHEAGRRVSSPRELHGAEFGSSKARQQSLQSSALLEDSYVARSGPLQRASSVRDVRLRNWPLVGQYGHTHAWPYVAMDGDLVVQKEDPVAGPQSCVDDPISVDCTGGFGGGIKSTGGPMDTRVGWRHDNELGYRPEIDGPVRTSPELQDAWNVYYGYASADRTRRSEGASRADRMAAEQQKLWDREADAAMPPPYTPFSARHHTGVVSASAEQQTGKRWRIQPFSPFAQS